MKVYKSDKSKMEPARYINLTVDDPNTFETIKRVKIDRKEAAEAIDYLRTHNGDAPEFVHELIDAMELAMTLRIPAYRNR